ncbi:MAG: NfeD family protein [Actinomycetia bacterium]|nr:NfeD family protein [Actinomycetes bacterium]
MVSLDLILLMLAVGAFAGSVTAAVGASLAPAIIVAIATSVAMLYFVRPSIVRRMHGGPELTTGTAALVGEHAVVVDRVSRAGGRIKLAGEVWTARSYDTSIELEAGTEVAVLEIDGATAVVFPQD